MKYKTIVVYENFEAWCDFLHKQCIYSVNSDRKKSHAEHELGDIRKHVMAKVNNIFNKENMFGEPVKITLRYNVLQWQKDNYKHPLSEYETRLPQQAVYVIKEANKRIVEEILLLSRSEKKVLWKAIGNRYYLPAIFREGRIMSES